MTWAYGFNKNGGCSFVSHGEFISGGPEWIKSERFQIQALMPDGSPEYTTAQFLNGDAPKLELMIKNLLADRMGETWRRNLQMDGQDSGVVNLRLDKSRQRILSAPVIILPCLYLEDLDRYPDERRQADEKTMAIQSIGAAIQNMLLMAYDLGLDTGWMCAPLFCPEVVCEALALDPRLIPHALITVGYAAAAIKMRVHETPAQAGQGCNKLESGTRRERAHSAVDQRIRLIFAQRLPIFRLDARDECIWVE